MADLMIVATIALVLLLVSGLPIFLVFLSVNAAIVLFQIGPSGYGMFVNSMLNTATTQALATIPLFILMGEVIFRAGAVERLFRSIQLVVGFIPGRQNVVTMLLAAVLSALSGASMAVAAMLGENCAANPFKSRLPKTNQRGDHTGGGKPRTHRSAVRVGHYPWHISRRIDR